MTVNVVSAIVYLFNIGSRSMSNYCVVSICFLDFVGDTLFMDHPSWYVHHAQYVSCIVCMCVDAWRTILLLWLVLTQFLKIFYIQQENHPVNMTFGNGNLFNHTYIDINLFNTNLTDKLEISLCLIGRQRYNMVQFGHFGKIL